MLEIWETSGKSKGVIFLEMSWMQFLQGVELISKQIDGKIK